MAGIFISYRRDDSRHAAGRLGEDLAGVFGAAAIFRDVESIDPGVDFEVALDQALKSCAVMLVVIGPRWLNIEDAQGRRRLDQPGDWIRLEVAQALQRQVRLIPLLLEDTPLPAATDLPEDLRALVRRQSLPLSDARWRGDLQRLVETLERIPGIVRVAPPPPAPAPRPVTPDTEPGGSRKGLWTGVGLGAGGLLVVAALLAESPDKTAPGATAQPPPSTVATPAPAPAPAPATAPAPTQLTSPEHLRAIADRVLQGQWQAAGDASVFIVLQQQGAQVAAQFFGSGQPVGTGSGEFDGQRLVVQIQLQLMGQPLMPGRCTLLWVAERRQLQGPCQWPVGTEIVTWNRVAQR